MKQSYYETFGLVVFLFLIGVSIGYVGNELAKAHINVERIVLDLNNVSK